MHRGTRDQVDELNPDNWLIMQTQEFEGLDRWELVYLPTETVKGAGSRLAVEAIKRLMTAR
jgi:hypothetical protein